MRLVPSSLGGRLLLAASAFIAVALVLASVLIGFILHRFVVGQLDQRLDAQIATISDALLANPDGSIALGRTVDLPPFDRRGSGWYWQVSGEGVDLRSASLGSGTIDMPPEPLDWHRWVEGRGTAAETTTKSGDTLHLRVASSLVGSKPLTITVSAPSQVIAKPLREALLPLVASLAALGLALILASFAQVRLGLRPLRRLLCSLRDVRSGSITHVPVDQPSELRPLAAELNGLIDQNAAGLVSARLHVANLAHGLKTPLASLAMELSDAARDPEGILFPLVMQIERRIRHHLGRARVAALGNISRSRVLLAPRVADIASALAKIYSDKPVLLDVAVDPKLAIACEAQDLDEMVGNLLDNGFKWASSRLVIRGERMDRKVILTMEDDGPGLPETFLQSALLPGQRLDERVPGDGFGLTITRELAELHGGSLLLSSSPGKGLRVSLTLPEGGPLTP